MRSYVPPASAAGSTTPASTPPSSAWAATPAVAAHCGKRRVPTASAQEPKSKRVAAATDSQDRSPIPVSQLSQESADPASQGADEEEQSAVEERQVHGTLLRTRQLVYPSRPGHRQMAALFKHMAACYLRITMGDQATIRYIHTIHTQHRYDTACCCKQPIRDTIAVLLCGHSGVLCVRVAASCTTRTRSCFVCSSTRIVVCHCWNPSCRCLEEP